MRDLNTPELADASADLRDAIDRCGYYPDVVTDSLEVAIAGEPIRAYVLQHEPRIDLEPAVCADPNCEADHGYTGSVAADDISLRISAAADGPAGIQQVLEFAKALSFATTSG